MGPKHKPSTAREKGRGTDLVVKCSLHFCLCEKGTKTWNLLVGLICFILSGTIRSAIAESRSIATVKGQIEVVLFIIVVLPTLYANIWPAGRTPKLTKFGRQVRIDEKKWIKSKRNGKILLYGGKSATNTHTNDMKCSTVIEQSLQ